MNKIYYYIASVLILLTGCSQSSHLHISTTIEAPWQMVTNIILQNSQTASALSLTINTADTGQVIEGFGACFNELGWDALSFLSEEDRNEVLQELFQPGKGANFNICRMPIAANDFSRDWYSYAEAPNDYAMEHFSIEHDKETLIPFIHSALKLNPDIRIWASPWCPPTWMKTNGHYASRYQRNCHNDKFRNGLLLSQEGHEGTDMFRTDSIHLNAYALYFQKFIQAYRKNGINIFAVMPQNEYNSAQVFPSCIWTANSLAKFIGSYLGPVMKKEGVEVMFGTMERPHYLQVDTILQNPSATPYISGVGFQWAGRKAIGEVRKRYPQMRLLQTEQECGNGKNDWEGLLHSWDILKHFVNNGVSIYNYWNMALLEGGVSRWGWAQNSLAVVDSTRHTYRWTPEYYLMKHVSHFVSPDAHYIKSTGEAAQKSISFVNPDGQIIIIMVEEDGQDQWIEISASGKEKKMVLLRANSINTICL